MHSKNQGGLNTLALREFGAGQVVGTLYTIVPLTSIQIYVNF